jgi:O-antigen/teichoic acid export membrane protein
MTAAGVTLLLNVSSKILTLATSIVVARWLGVEGYGVFATATAALAVLSIISNLGFPVLTARLLAAYRENREWELMRGLIGHSSRMTILASLFFTGLGSIGAWLLRDRMSALQLETIWWAMATLPLASLVELYAANLRGLHRTLISQLPQHFVLPWLFLALLLAWRFTVSDAPLRLTPNDAFSLRFLSTCAALVIGVWSLLRCLPKQLGNVRPRVDLGRWYQSAWPLLFLGFAAVITTQTDVLMLSALAGADSAGVYQAAARGAELVAFSLVIVATVTQAMIARLHETGDLAELQRVVTASARGALALSLPVALVLIVFAEPLLVLAFGADFQRGAACLIILSVAQMFNVAVGVVGLILNMTGHERVAAFGLAVGAVTNLVLNALLIPIWGINGAATATGLSLVVWNTILIIAVRKRTGLRPTALG